MSDVQVTKKTAETASAPAFWDPTAWNFSPFSLMRHFTEEMERFFGNGGMRLADGTWSPRVEFEQANGTLKVKADLPGMKKEDIKVEASSDGLVIKGERREQHEEKKEGFYRSEMSYGSFYRLIPLPEGAEVEKAKADYANGVLEVTVPVPQPKKAEKRQIPVQAKAA